MLLGPDKVIACPTCTQLSRVFTLRSGNTIGAIRWTDGKVSAPMLPQPPAVTRCPFCGSFFWVSQAHLVGEVGWDGYQAAEIPKEWNDAPQLRDLSEEEALRAIQEGVAGTREQELQLRLLAWRAGNEGLRGPGRGLPQGGRASGGRKSRLPRRSPAARENLERLRGLLQATNPEERLLKAEGARELGRFEEALQLLDFAFSDDYRTTAERIRKLAEAEDPLVREIVNRGD